MVRERRGRAENLGRGGPGRLGRLRDPDDVARDLAGARRGLGDVTHDLLSRGTLLLDRRRDTGGDAVDLADPAGDPPYGRYGVLGHGSDRADLSGDLVRDPGGLAGEILHLGGDDGEATPSLPGPSRLDGGVERQQVGLTGDVRDQPDHLADLHRRLIQGLHELGRFTGLLGCRPGELGRARDLTADLIDRNAEFLGGCRDGLDVAGSLLGRDRDRGGLHRRDAGCVGHPLGGCLQLGCRVRHGADDADHGLLEAVGQFGPGAAALGRGLSVGPPAGLRLLSRLPGDHALDPLDRAPDSTDLVAAGSPGNLAVDLPTPHPLEGSDQAFERRRHAEDDHGDARRNGGDETDGRRRDQRQGRPGGGSLGRVALLLQLGCQDIDTRLCQLP
jgi:hypothetical protein